MADIVADAQLAICHGVYHRQGGTQTNHLEAAIEAMSRHDFDHLSGSINHMWMIVCAQCMVYGPASPKFVELFWSLTKYMKEGGRPVDHGTLKQPGFDEQGPLYWEWTRQPVMLIRWLAGAQGENDVHGECARLLRFMAAVDTLSGLSAPPDEMFMHTGSKVVAPTRAIMPQGHEYYFYGSGSRAVFQGTCEWQAESLATFDMHVLLGHSFISPRALSRKLDWDSGSYEAGDAMGAAILKIGRGHFYLTGTHPEAFIDHNGATDATELIADVEESGYGLRWQLDVMRFTDGTVLVACDRDTNSTKPPINAVYSVSGGVQRFYSAPDYEGTGHSRHSYGQIEVSANDGARVSAVSEADGNEWQSPWVGAELASHWRLNRLGSLERIDEDSGGGPVDPPPPDDEISEEHYTSLANLLRWAINHSIDGEGSDVQAPSLPNFLDSDDFRARAKSFINKTRGHD